MDCLGRVGKESLPFLLAEALCSLRDIPSHIWPGVGHSPKFALPAPEGAAYQIRHPHGLPGWGAGQAATTVSQDCVFCG